MNAKYVKIAGLAMVIAALCLVQIVSLHAKPNSTRPGTAAVTTNWVGCLVTGMNVPVIDPMPGTTGPRPAMIRHIEIGLRSDGVVVWRKSKETR